MSVSKGKNAAGKEPKKVKCKTCGRRFTARSDGLPHGHVGYGGAECKSPTFAGQGKISKAQVATLHPDLSKLFAPCGPAPHGDVLAMEDWLSRVFARCVFVARSAEGKAAEDHLHEVRLLAEVAKRAVLAAATAVARDVGFESLPEDAEPPLETPLLNALWACRECISELDALMQGSGEYKHLARFRGAVKSAADLGIPSAEMRKIMLDLKLAKRAQRKNGGRAKMVATRGRVDF